MRLGIIQQLIKVIWFPNCIFFCDGNLVTIGGELCLEGLREALTIRISGIKEERYILCMQRLFSVLRSNHALAHIRRRYPEKVRGYARQRITRSSLRNHRN